jgi:hypothetical protein
MKHFRTGIVLLVCVFLFGSIVPAHANDIFMKGKGIGWNYDWGLSSSNTDVQDVPIDIVFRLVAKGLLLNWEVQVTIAEFGYNMKFMLDDQTGSLYPDPSGEYVHIWANNCWGGEYCSPDPSKPDSEGSANLEIRANLITLQAYLSLNHWTDNQNSGSSLNFLGEAAITSY